MSLPDVGIYKEKFLLLGIYCLENKNKFYIYKFIYYKKQTFINIRLLLKANT